MRSQRVQPSAQPITRFRNLNLNVRLRARVISPAELLICFVLLEDIFAVDGVGVLRPGKSTLTCCRDVGARDPRGALRFVDSTVDARHQDLRPRLILGDGGTAGRFLDHLRVPAMVQIRSRAVPGNGNAIAANLHGLVVQRLSDISEEMDQEFKVLFLFGCRLAGILYSSSLCRNTVNTFFSKQLCGRLT